MYYEKQDITPMEFCQKVKQGDMPAFYTNAWWAFFSKAIRFASINIKDIKGVAMDHVASAIKITNNEITIQENVMFDHRYKWHQAKFWKGCVQEKTFNLQNYNDENNIFNYYKKKKKTLMLVPLARPLTQEEKILFEKDRERVKDGTITYNIIYAILAEGIDPFPQFIRNKINPRLAKTNGYFCSRLLQKRYYYSKLITEEEYLLDPLRSPAQLLKLSCFLKKNGKTLIYIVK